MTTSQRASVVRITEYLAIDLDTERWICHKCEQDLVDARENYKKGCLVYERDPAEVYPPIFPDQTWTGTTREGYGTFIEFYCPGCGTNLETELLPDGFPPTHDIELDIDALKAKHQGGTQ